MPPLVNILVGKNARIDGNRISWAGQRPDDSLCIFSGDVFRSLSFKVVKLNESANSLLPRCVFAAFERGSTTCTDISHFVKDLNPELDKKAESVIRNRAKKLVRCFSDSMNNLVITEGCQIRFRPSETQGKILGQMLINRQENKTKLEMLLEPNKQYLPCLVLFRCFDTIEFAPDEYNSKYNVIQVGTPGASLNPSILVSTTDNIPSHSAVSSDRLPSSAKSFSSSSSADKVTTHTSSSNNGTSRTDHSNHRLGRETSTHSSSSSHTRRSKSPASRDKYKGNRDKDRHHHSDFRDHRRSNSRDRHRRSNSRERHKRSNSRDRGNRLSNRANSTNHYDRSNRSNSFSDNRRDHRPMDHSRDRDKHRDRNETASQVSNPVVAPVQNLVTPSVDPRADPRLAQQRNAQLNNIQVNPQYPQINTAFNHVSNGYYVPPGHGAHNQVYRGVQPSNVRPPYVQPAYQHHTQNYAANNYTQLVNATPMNGIIPDFRPQPVNHYNQPRHHQVPQPVAARGARPLSVRQFRSQGSTQSTWQQGAGRYHNRLPLPTNSRHTTPHVHQGPPSAPVNIQHSTIQPSASTSSWNDNRSQGSRYNDARPELNFHQPLRTVVAPPQEHRPRTTSVSTPSVSTPRMMDARNPVSELSGWYSSNNVVWDNDYKCKWKYGMACFMLYDFKEKASFTVQQIGAYDIVQGAQLGVLNKRCREMPEIKKFILENVFDFDEAGMDDPANTDRYFLKFATNFFNKKIEIRKVFKQMRNGRKVYTIRSYCNDEHIDTLPIYELYDDIDYCIYIVFPRRSEDGPQRAYDCIIEFDEKRAQRSVQLKEGSYVSQPQQFESSFSDDEAEPLPLLRPVQINNYQPRHNRVKEPRRRPTLEPPSMSINEFFSSGEEEDGGQTPLTPDTPDTVDVEMAYDQRIEELKPHIPKPDDLVKVKAVVDGKQVTIDNPVKIERDVVKAAKPEKTDENSNGSDEIEVIPYVKPAPEEVIID